jgi:hypothetical protein
MLAIVRIKTRNGNDVIWDYITKNHHELEKGYDNCVEIMYMTKRDKYEDTSLFLHSGDPNCIGDFIAKIIAPIPGVDEIWMLNMMNMRFFFLDNSLLDKWERYVVTIRTKPNKFEETYNTISKLKPSSSAAPVYLAYTFHLYGDSIMFSLIADDKESAEKYVNDHIKVLPDVFRTHLTSIQKQVRLTTPESWKIYVKTNLIAQEISTKPNKAEVSV